MTEACQLIETENIALKKEIKELKEKLATSAVPVQAPNLNAGEEKFAIRRSCATMRNTIMRFQSELVKLKLTSVQEINWLVAQKQLLSNAFNRYVSLYNIRDAQYEAMEYARDQLQERLDGAQQDLRDGVSSMSQEHDKMKLKYKNARTDLINAQEEIIRLKELAKTIEEKYTLLTTAKAESDAHYNVNTSVISDTLTHLHSFPLFLTGAEQGVPGHAGAGGSHARGGRGRVGRRQQPQEGPARVLREGTHLSGRLTKCQYENHRMDGCYFGRIWYLCCPVWALLACRRTLPSYRNRLLMQIVGELGYENEYLRKTCAEQEEQVRRLSLCCGAKLISFVLWLGCF